MFVREMQHICLGILEWFMLYKFKKPQFMDISCNKTCTVSDLLIDSSIDLHTVVYKSCYDKCLSSKGFLKSLNYDLLKSLLGDGIVYLEWRVMR